MTKVLHEKDGSIMNPLRRKILLKAFKLFDLFNMCLCFFLGKFAVSHQTVTLSLSQISQIEVKVQNLVFFLVSFLTWQIVFSTFALYQSKRLSNQWTETVDAIKATSIGSLAIYMEGILFGINILTPFFFLVFWTTSSTITILSRLVLRYALRQIRIRGRNLRHILVIGTNPRAIQIANRITTTPELGYRFIGFVDNEWAGIKNLRKTGYALVCDLNNFPGFIREQVVDEVMIALPIKSLYDQASLIVSLCEEQGILVRYLSSIFSLKLAHSKNEYFEDYPFTILSTGKMDGWPVLVKRMIDIFLSLILLLVFLPLLFATALLIMLTSPGSVFFIQERMGLNKRRFRLYKFRTMIPEAEKMQSRFELLNEVDGPVFKIENDPRITLTGKFLRKTSIDELPQFINVLKGDMSLVGPRPLPVRDYRRFNEAWHGRRFSVRPGITCLWQVCGRSSIPFEKWMELDMEYIDKWSLFLDFKILFKTIPAVLRGSGAA